MTAITAWASAYPLLAGLLCVLVIAGCVVAAGVVVPWCVREWRDLGSKGDPARHAKTAATGEPAELLAAPVWAGPFAAIDPYVTGEPGLPVAVTGNVPGRPADPARDAAPGLVRLPEGDTQPPAWPPQEAASPGGLPPVLTPRLSTALAVAAFLVEGLTEAVRAAAPPPGIAAYGAGLKAAAAQKQAWQEELRAEAERTSPWKDRPPLAEAMGFSDDTLVRIDARQLMAGVEEYAKRVSAA